MGGFDSVSILFIQQPHGSIVEPLAGYLRLMPHLRVSQTSALSGAPPDVDVIVTTGGENLDAMAPEMVPFVEQGGAWLHIADLFDEPLPGIFGVQPGAVGPSCELRILFSERTHPMAERLADAVYVPGRFQELRIDADDVESLLYADWQYSHRTVVSRRRAGRGQAACTTLQAFDRSEVQQIAYRLILLLAGMPFGRRLGVGILGYAPSVGRMHGLGCQHVRGLDLVAACDLNPERLDRATADFPHIKTYDDGDAMAGDPDVDLVIIATPPNTHARIALGVMAAGRHVVCEKPLAMNRGETESLLAAADTYDVHLSCHQNRRFDVDYLTIRDTVARGLIGEPFYLETFVGGFSHPCGYWHSHTPVSGGTTYDWGAHYLDWIVSLFPFPVASVVGTRHKRVWQDVSNADQERIQIRFQGGMEAEFIHSDIAAIRKPKWYLLGTEGALVGYWNDIRTYDADADRYYRRRDIPATEMPPVIEIRRRDDADRTSLIRPAMPAREPYAFHRNMADHLLTGEPLAAPLGDSVKVVAILEAAARSMEKNGSVEVLDG